MCYELGYLLEEVGDPAPIVSRTGVRGLIVAKTGLNQFDTIGKLRAILQEKPYKFRYALRILPVEKVVPTNLDEIKGATAELSNKIGENESFRVTVEKRFTDLHSRDFIEAIASGIQRKVNLSNPDGILVIEVVGQLTGISVIGPSDILFVMKEKML